jgi:transcriptional regulator GlxA family with amidase domain
MHGRYREHLTLTDIAGQVRVHPVHLARAFRKRYTYRIGDFIRKLRVEAACSELLQSDAPIAEIAARTGFTDQSHLSHDEAPCRHFSGRISQNCAADLNKALALK